MSPRRKRKTLRRLAAAVVIAAAVAAAFAAVWVFTHARSIRRLARGADETIFLDAAGAPWFALDERRQYVPLAEISPALRRAVVAVEDRRFYRHPGVDAAGIARALLSNLRRGRIAEGGSTITQQLARTLYLSRRRTLERKIREIALALLMERILSKDRILELYLNRVPFGGVSGVEALSLDLFGKHAAALTLAESALVAGVICSPSALAPAAHYEEALARSRLVLARMREEGYISAEEEGRAQRDRPRVRAAPGFVEARSGYARDYLRTVFREQVSEDYPSGWRVRTSFRVALQQAAEEAVAHGLGRLGVPGLQGALVALDPGTGDVLALVGGSDFASSPFNRALSSHRQPGSAFKPIVYAAALEHGSSPITPLPGLESPAKVPLTLREALLSSDNPAALALQEQVGTAAVQAMAGRLGLGAQPAVPSLALGTGSVTPLELTAAFAVFANGGFAVRPRALLDVLDQQGETVFADPGERRRVLSPPVAFQMVTLLRDVIEQGTGRAAAAAYPLAGKTGTTDGYRDAWFVGFSSRIAAGVWVGFDQPAQIMDEGYAARVALPIWSEFMGRAAAVLPPGAFAPPPGLRAVELCRVSYLLPLAGCPPYTEYLKEGDAVPTQSCSLHGGTIRERVVRAVGGFLDRIRGLFHRR